MKIKVEERWYDTEDSAVMLVFESNSERKELGRYLAEMEDGLLRFAMFPESLGMSLAGKEFWMKGSPGRDRKSVV